MNSKDDAQDKLAALKRLRELPRNTQVDSRIAAIQELLGEAEIFATLQKLRWPDEIICPRCHSNHVVRRDPPPNAVDQRAYYVCLNCKGEGNPSSFDDFTGLPINSIHSLRQCILCWYLIGFCSLDHIAKVLGLSREAILQMALFGNQLTDTPKPEQPLGWQFSAKQQESTQRATVTAKQEDVSRSVSKAPLKPSPKSKF